MNEAAEDDDDASLKFMSVLVEAHAKPSYQCPVVPA